MHGWLADELRAHRELVVMGDFNIAPDDRDVNDPAVWNDDHILTSTAERAALTRLLGLGLHDAFRLHHDEAGIFSWWDYRQAAFRRNLGLRIDLTLVSDALKARTVDGGHRSHAAHLGARQRPHAGLGSAGQRLTLAHWTHPMGSPEILAQ